jgi:hypothetical protein
MDLLDRVVGPGSDLLARVDAVLTRCGAPGDHPVWREISRTGTLPSTALAQIAALAPDEMRSRAADLARIASGVRSATDPVPSSLDSRGAVADGFARTWRALSAQITAGSDGATFADRVAATAEHLDDIAAWASAARRDLAGEIGACLGSSEAVAVRAAAAEPDDDAVRAAADIAACVLASISRSVDDGWVHFEHGSGLDRETPVTTVLADSLGADRVELR